MGGPQDPTGAHGIPRSPLGTRNDLWGPTLGSHWEPILLSSSIFFSLLSLLPSLCPLSSSSPCLVLALSSSPPLFFLLVFSLFSCRLLFAPPHFSICPCFVSSSPYLCPLVASSLPIPLSL